MTTPDQANFVVHDCGKAVDCAPSLKVGHSKFHTVMVSSFKAQSQVTSKTKLANQVPLIASCHESMGVAVAVVYFIVNDLTSSPPDCQTC